MGSAVTHPECRTQRDVSRTHRDVAGTRASRKASSPAVGTSPAACDDHGMQTIGAGTLAGLAARFPDWHIWRSRDGRGREADWNATRRRKLRAAPPGIVASVTAPDAGGLHGLLEQQQAAEAAQAAYAA